MADRLAKVAKVASSVAIGLAGPLNFCGAKKDD